MTKLNLKYPKRKLEIIGVKDFKDIIDRRNLVEIKKKNIIKWGSRKLLKNKLSATLLTVIMIFIGSYFLISQDNNPHHIEYSSSSYLIKNKYGNVLWEKKTERNLKKYSKHVIVPYQKIIDYNHDGINEIMISEKKLYLFDHNGNEIWSYKNDFKNVETDNEIFKDTFVTSKIIGVDQKGDTSSVYLLVTHNPYYPTAIVRINLKTGEKFGEEFWHSGRINYSKLVDLDGNGDLEILAAGTHNGLGRAVIFLLNVEKLRGQSPTVKNYIFKNEPISQFKKYILLPKPDFFEYGFAKYFVPYGLNIENKFIDVSIAKPGETKSTNIAVSTRFNLDLLLNEIVIVDGFSSARDLLVKEGILSHPLSDTDEYRQILMDQIKYWDGEKFVTINSN